MQEILSKTDNPKDPLCHQEFYELRLYDSESGGEPVHSVRQAHALWNDEAGEAVWDRVQVQAFAGLALILTERLTPEERNCLAPVELDELLTDFLGIDVQGGPRVIAKFNRQICHGHPLRILIRCGKQALSQQSLNPKKELDLLFSRRHHDQS